MFSCAISGTTFCGVVHSRNQHQLYRFRLDMSHPCSGSLVGLSPFSVIDQNLHTTLSHLTQDIWEIQDRLVLAKREYVSQYSVSYLNRKRIAIENESYSFKRSAEAFMLYLSISLKRINFMSQSVK